MGNGEGLRSTRLKEGRPDSFVVLSPVQDRLSGDEGFGVQTTHGAKEDQERAGGE